MTCVLVFNENDLERSVVFRMLSAELQGAEVLVAKTPKEALQKIETEPIDLLIADIPSFNWDFSNFISHARKLVPELLILITSVKNKKEVADFVWRLEVQDYLLKPYRPAWLIGAVRSIVKDGQSSTAQSRQDWQRSRYLDRMTSYLRLFQYKKCTDEAREYLDQLYERADNAKAVQLDIVAFAEEVVGLCDPLGLTVRRKVARCFSHLRPKIYSKSRKYDMYVVLEKLLDRVFAILEEEGLYAADDKQRILNYIDRNMRGRISLEEAAEYANMSPSYFSKTFKKLTGEGFIEYVASRKAEYAKRLLLDTDMPVSSIAHELSYNEASYFAKAFKKKTGVSPTEYREQCHAQGAKR